MTERVRVPRYNYPTTVFPFADQRAVQCATDYQCPGGTVCTTVGFCKPWDAQEPGWVAANGGVYRTDLTPDWV